MGRVGEALLVILGKILILAGALAILGVTIPGREVEWPAALALIGLGILMCLAPRFRKIIINIRKGKIVIVRDLLAKNASKGFDELDKR